MNTFKCGRGLAPDEVSSHKRISAHDSKNISNFPLKKTLKPFYPGPSPTWHSFCYSQARQCSSTLHKNN
ncbi:hypothetical protein C4J95_4251 [Pseudomonas orientalis]|nr:hypothetical protein C4J95_4251 [Pseudomonas orientalis]